MLAQSYFHLIKYALTALLVFLISLSGLSQEKENYGNTPNKLVPYGNYQKAYKMFFVDPQLFLGPGRDKMAPLELESVRIGFLGPLEGSVEEALGRQMLQGSVLAIEEANAKGGYNGLPFELMKRY
jgi:branched-chain amino acid transport system substrate-binding protein